MDSTIYELTFSGSKILSVFVSFYCFFPLAVYVRQVVTAICIQSCICDCNIMSCFDARFIIGGPIQCVLSYRDQCARNTLRSLYS